MSPRTTTEERNVRRLKGYIEDVWEDGNLDAIEEYASPTYVEHQLSHHGEDVDSLEAHRANVERFLTAFPDLSFEIDWIVADGDTTVQWFTCRGTHEGPLDDIPATGETVDVSAVGITRWRDGKMVEDWSQVGMFELLDQLGVKPG